MKFIIRSMGLAAALAFGGAGLAFADEGATAKTEPQVYMNVDTGQVATISPDGQLVPTDQATLGISIVPNSDDSQSLEARGRGHWGYRIGWGYGRGWDHDRGWGYHRGWRRGYGWGWRVRWAPVYPCYRSYDYPYCYR